MAISDFKYVMLGGLVATNVLATPVFSDFSDKIDIPSVKSVAIENQTQKQFNTYLKNTKTHKHKAYIGAMYSPLTPDEQIKYKYQKGILRETVKFESLYKYTYDVQTSTNRVEKQTHYMFWE
ncbi:hypothetical protein [Pseudoalteromonas luteoviolacea]|uniref:Uncharacterized protein n=1 Tax=Pseudoalteromonas luteoviolacea S4054 TaxID=1129367 RepID=A0A0F6AG29_9GAMM|nr:hypothetical protein [Pseudoalteromonas luteoviolacea]AOT08367.1 hypothetical protein S4054249_11150 [Pseudoalteromonas luteoviolacea]AOT13283.1 hypothetical protein S40542_11125 [Pseudoalteromonas luteoviolacea]AOT18196.1 hypothetical protein S4054_11125 [Pseudoalteromonas luteoviolacea]KKE84314.1 hypothetical protein N479_10465 [Pseudoalteromonas luteoviolacea S4054]KZN76081.1 hypothetical protein N481_06950 [Pseudoalteromonas luteoviolacea S4047-1]